MNDQAPKTIAAAFQMLAEALVERAVRGLIDGTTTHEQARAWLDKRERGECAGILPSTTPQEN